MRDKERLKRLLIIGGVGLLLIGLAIWYLYKEGVFDEAIKRAQYAEGEETSQTNDYNDSTKWLSYEEYKAINSDTIGVLAFSDRQFPVVQTDDNETYLTTSIYGEYDIFGVPFLDASIDLETTDNLIIHGHSTYSKDLLFTFFSKYISDPSWGEENRTFYWTDETGTYEYSIIAVTQIEVNAEDSDMYWFNWSWNSNMEKVAYMMNIINSADVFYSTSFNYTEDYITLVTCNMDNTDERYVVSAVYVGKVE